MAYADDNSHSGGSRRGGSVTCKPLLDIATPEMFRTNAFRITGLPVDATARAIAKHADKLKMMEELGQGKSVHTGAFAFQNPPTVDQIREAIQRLKDPEQRIIDEFFWFWPRQFGQSASDPAILALEGGDADAAFDIWTALETSPSDGPVAMHNVAVLRHLMALEWENHYARTDGFTQEKRRETEKLWRAAFKRWDLLAVDDLFWESVSARITQLDDPRLTSGFARRMRATLPHAIDKINAELAVRYAESERMDLAQAHVQFMRETNQGLDNIDKTAELVLAPATSRLKQQIQLARERAAKNPVDAVKAALELLDHARRALPLFELFFGKESVARNELSDEIAALCNHLPIDYHKATGDDKGCIDLLRAALAFATSIDLRQQIEKSIGTLTGNLTFKQLEPVYAILKALQDSGELPSIRFSRFKREAVPAVSKASTGIVGSEDHVELVNAAAIVLRAISLAAWNDHKDMATAVAANDMAAKYARDADIRQRLTADQTTLREMAAQKKSTNHSGTGCLVVLGIIGLCVLIGSFNSNKGSSSSSYSPSSVSTPSRYTAPSSTYNAPPSLYIPPLASDIAPSAYKPPTTHTAPAPYGSSDKSTYRVPSSITSELDRDKRAIENERAKTTTLERRLESAKQLLEGERSKAEDWESQLESLNAQVASARRYLDNTSQFDVDDFNRKVNRYNAALANVRAQNDRTNRAVQSYNSTLEEIRAQNRIVNQMVDDYNAKLRQYGR
jgi:hypothetical protein